MIKYSKYKAKKLEYVKELLEGKYLKFDNDDNFVYVKKVNCLRFGYSFYDFDIHRVSIGDNYSKITVIKDDVDEIERICKHYSFTTKEEFMKVEKEAMKNIKREIAKI